MTPSQCRDCICGPCHLPASCPSWEQCKAMAQQVRQLPPSLPPALAATVPSNPPLAQKTPAAVQAGGPVDGAQPSWETTLAELSPMKLKEEISRLQTLRSHLEVFQCTTSLVEIDIRLAACRKAPQTASQRASAASN